MLLPTQQTAGLAARGIMQAALDSIEERRRQEEEQARGAKRDPIAEARVSAGTEAKRAREKIAEALFGLNNVDPNELKIQLIERLAAKLGLDLEEERSGFALGRAIEEAVKDLGLDAAKLEEELGLKAAGVSLATVIAAIKNPYGDDNSRLLEGLTKVANGGKADFDVSRVLQRLNDVADPKTLEELKLGPQGYDPTRVEDAEARAERQQDIQALEASEKLEDVQQMQDALEEHNDRAVKPDIGHGTGSGAATTDADIVLLLGATVEQARNTEADTDAPPAGPATDIAHPVEDAVPGEVTELNAEAHEELSAEAVTKVEVLPVSVDEIGLYQLLKKKLAA
ncbi:hypothetical protein REJC140_02823 [Pseudorhizobium endolithicum]|uniref:Uncharacterized protein n=1 Tax=Pseudorhizobium endolithicum TaxID=1191678 RepID=A0ABM8PHF7_9HYPH|nr:hypothetical protein [Pseudorhizobium endolithicum]CAD7030366.1 hypothetical protein REJC140_02823 [Pseudorhizobium endolithicum]